MKKSVKRISASLVALLVLMLSCCTVFAAESPTGAPDIKVVVIPTEGGTGTYETTTEVGKGPNGGTLVNFYPKPNQGYTFVEWKLEGQYQITKGSLTTPEFQIEAFSDIEATPYYTKGGTTGGEVVSNDSKTSPKTGDASAVAFVSVAVLLAAGGALFTLKKISSK